MGYLHLEYILTMPKIPLLLLIYTCNSINCKNKNNLNSPKVEILNSFGGI